MAYDEALADRIRAVLGDRRDVSERKMFGGLAFMVTKGMAVGIVGSDLMVRVGPDAWEAALARPHARPMDFTGKPMKGFVYVAPAGMKTTRQLSDWVARGLSFVDKKTEAPSRPRADAGAPARKSKGRRKVTPKKKR